MYISKFDLGRFDGIPCLSREVASIREWDALTGQARRDAGCALEARAKELRARERGQGRLHAALRCENLARASLLELATGSYEVQSEEWWCFNEFRWRRVTRYLEGAMRELKMHRRHIDTEIAGPPYVEREERWMWTHLTPETAPFQRDCYARL